MAAHAGPIRRCLQEFDEMFLRRRGGKFVRLPNLRCENEMQALPVAVVEQDRVRQRSLALGDGRKMDRAGICKCGTNVCSQFVFA